MFVFNQPMLFQSATQKAKNVKKKLDLSSLKMKFYPQLGL